MMKKPSILMSVIAAIAICGLMAGCQTVAPNHSAIAESQKEMLLTQAGFRTKTVTTPQQHQIVSMLPLGRVSAVTYKGTLYYVYPTSTKNQIYFGKQAQFDAYKAALRTKQSQQQRAGYPTIIEETGEPHNVVVREFEGFGPLGTDTGDF